MNNKNVLSMQAIRRHIYKLIILVMVLGLVATIYSLWQKKVTEQLLHEANDYHLSSGSHYLKAIGMLHHAQNHLTFKLLQNHSNDDVYALIMGQGHEYKDSVSFYLIRQEIKAGLDLHHQYSDREFDYLTGKLSRQLNMFESKGQLYFLKGEESEQVAADLRNLLLSLRQLEGLHLSKRDVLLDQLSTLEERQDRVLFVLLVMLLLAGFMVSKKSLASLDLLVQEQKQVERVLRESESRFRNIFENTDLVSVQGYDHDRKVIFWNKTSELIYGYSREQALGKKLEDLIVPESKRQQSIKDVDQWISDGEGLPSSELTQRNADNQAVEVFSSHVLLRNTNNEPELYCIDIDLTELKKAERKIKRDEQWIRQLLDTLPHGVQECDLDGRISYGNIAHHRILGMSDDLEGYYIWDFQLHEHHKKEMQVKLKQTVKHLPKPEAYLLSNLTQDGRPINLQVDWDYRRDEEGEVNGFISIISDITERKQIEDQLKKSEKSLAYAQQIVHAGNWELELAEGTRYWSDEVFRIFELNPETSEPSHEVFLELVHPEDREMVSKAYDESINNGISYDMEHRLLMKDGRIKYVLERGETFSDAQGKALRSIGIVMDITERVEVERALRKSEQRFQVFAETAADLFWEMDETLRFTYVSGKIDKVLGQEAGDVIGKKRQELYFGQYIAETPEFIHHLQLLDEHQPFEKFEISWQRDSGEMSYIQVSGKPIFDVQGVFKGYRGVSQDVTESRLAEDKILQQAHFDSLTNLPNRFLSLDRLSQLISEAERDEEKVAVLFLDLDDFKKVNDSLGHETGDKLLIEAAIRLRDVVRSGDTVGRLGGDEFILLLGGIADAADVQPTAENLLNCLREPFSIDGRELVLSASIGIAVYPQDGNTASEILRNADSAMYHAKDLGRNAYSYFTETMNRDVSRRLEIEEQIHGALERNEFSVFYQPQVEVVSNKIIGAEALLRWNNPVLGNVSPMEFIPIAEQTGLIVPLGAYVLSEALSMTIQWQQTQAADFQISVNLSPRQFRDPDLVSNIDQLINQYGLSSHSLELEITEGVLMSGHAYIDNAMDGLNKLGVSIAMDDFGTGYSSLSYLRSYPFDVLKIDKSFIRDITIDPSDRELINATVAMAHGLNLKVVAEGVETKEQYDYLEILGCDYVQGYLIGKPVPAEAFTKKLAKK